MDAMASQIIVSSIVYSGVESKQTSKLCVTGFCARNSPVIGEFSAQMASNAENVSIWWRQNDRCNHNIHPTCIRIIYCIHIMYAPAICCQSEMYTRLSTYVLWIKSVYIIEYYMQLFAVRYQNACLNLCIFYSGMKRISYIMFENEICNFEKKPC